MILEKIEGGLELESKRGGAKSSAGIMSRRKRQLTKSLFSSKLTFCIIIGDTDQEAAMRTLPDECLIKRSSVGVL